MVATPSFSPTGSPPGSGTVEHPWGSSCLSPGASDPAARYHNPSTSNFGVDLSHRDASDSEAACRISVRATPLPDINKLPPPDQFLQESISWLQIRDTTTNTGGNEVVIHCTSPQALDLLEVYIRRHMAQTSSDPSRGNCLLYGLYVMPAWYGPPAYYGKACLRIVPNYSDFPIFPTVTLIPIVKELGYQLSYSNGESWIFWRQPILVVKPSANPGEAAQMHIGTKQAKKDDAAPLGQSVPEGENPPTDTPRTALQDQPMRDPERRAMDEWTPVQESKLDEDSNVKPTLRSEQEYALNFLAYMLNELQRVRDVTDRVAKANLPVFKDEEASTSEKIRNRVSQQMASYKTPEDSKEGDQSGEKENPKAKEIARPRHPEIEQSDVTSVASFFSDEDDDYSDEDDEDEEEDNEETSKAPFGSFFADLAHLTQHDKGFRSRSLESARPRGFALPLTAGYIKEPWTPHFSDSVSAPGDFKRDVKLQNYFGF